MTIFSGKTLRSQLQEVLDLLAVLRPGGDGYVRELIEVRDALNALYTQGIANAGHKDYDPTLFDAYVKACRSFYSLPQSGQLDTSFRSLI